MEGNYNHSSPSLFLSKVINYRETICFKQPMKYIFFRNLPSIYSFIYLCMQKYLLDATQTGSGLKTEIQG